MSAAMRCVHCGRPRERHTAETLACPGTAGGAGNRYATMELPAGRICGQCVFFSYCKALFECNPGNTSCDWYPVRFVPAAGGAK